MDKNTEIKTCNQCSQSFDITQDDRDFYEKISPVFEGKKYKIPDPSLCPECRKMRRLSFRNERNLYRRKCDNSGEDIISMYSPETKYKVFSEKYWWSDSWNALDYGICFDKKKNFFDQFEELLRVVPQPALINHFRTLENSDYSNYSGYLKDCYLVYECGTCEDTLYSENSRRVKNSLDITLGTRCQECYFSVNIFDCHKIFYSTDSTACNNSYFLVDCHDCHYCYECYGLSNKSYCIKNVEYSQEEYFEKLTELLMEIDEHKLFSIKENNPQKVQGYGNENVSGNYIFNSKNVHESCHVKNLENGKYCSYLSSSSKLSQDCYDYDYFGGVQRVYESITVGGVSYGVYFSLNTWEGSHNNFYCNMCHGCKDVFACVGLKNQQYCIFNKQYTKKEYDELVPKIIEHMEITGEWGEFFPSSISPFGYNETLAMDLFFLTEDEAIEKGFCWSNYLAPFPKVEKTIPAKKLPKDTKNIPDDILNWAIECEVSKKPFMIMSTELAFYRKHNLKIPRRHPNQRYLDRLKLKK